MKKFIIPVILSLAIFTGCNNVDIDPEEVAEVIAYVPFSGLSEEQLSNTFTGEALNYIQAWDPGINISPDSQDLIKCSSSSRVTDKGSATFYYTEDPNKTKFKASYKFDKNRKIAELSIERK